MAKELSSSTDTCPDEYSSVSDGGTRRSDGFTLCMVPDVKVGDCMTGNIVGIDQKVPCTDPQASREITVFQPGTAGDAACTPNRRSSSSSRTRRRRCAGILPDPDQHIVGRT